MFKVTMLGMLDGFLRVEVKRPFGTIEKRDFTPAAFEEYISAIETYCEYKGYSLVIN
jgi:hypothetical protein